MSLQSERKVVLVTGCSKGGIGFSLCEEFAAKGCRVYASARRLESMEGFKYPDIQHIVLDVLLDDNVQSVVNTIIEAEGRIDVVVNNAGGICAGAIVDVPLDVVHRAFDTNVYGVLRVVKAVFPHMATRRSGTIVNIGSIAGNITTPWNGIYSAAKSALHSMTEALWQESKPFGVNIVLVAPGGIISNIASNQLAAGVSIPENSLYKSFTAQIINRVMASQSPGSMPAEEFSRRVVAEVLSPKPPRYMSVGKNTTLFWLLSWMSRTWALSFIWRVFSKVQSGSTSST